MIFVFSSWLIRVCHFITVFSVCNSQRKIIGGHDVSSDHRHMVYLIAAEEGIKRYSGWLCGGSLVQKRIAITSAACVRDFEFMYLVAGYNRYVADDKREEDECISKMKRKVINVCIPKDYTLNYTAPNVWAKLDIAVVKVDADVTGVEAYAQHCHYVPRPIEINFDNIELQEIGNDALLLGWGHTKTFRGTKDFMNKNVLQYASTRIYDKKKCIQAYKEFKIDALIEKYMICTWPPAPFNDQGQDQLSDYEQQNAKYNSKEGREACSGETKVKDVEDKAAIQSEEWEKDKVGICQNDHGGPLVAWQRSNPIIIGVASLFATNEDDECEGPFLFTSTYCNSKFLKCSIYELSKDDKPKPYELNIPNDDEPNDDKPNDDKPKSNELNKRSDDKLPDYVSKIFLVKLKNKSVKHTDKNHKPKDDKLKTYYGTYRLNDVSYEFYTYNDDLEKNFKVEIEINGVEYNVETVKEEIAWDTAIPKNHTIVINGITYVIDMDVKSEFRRSMPYYCIQAPEEKGFEIIERQISWLKHPHGPAETEKYHLRPQRPVQDHQRT